MTATVCYSTDYNSRLLSLISLLVHVHWSYHAVLLRSLSRAMSLRAAGPSGSSGLFRLLCFLLLVSYSLLASAATTVRQRILVLARDAASAYSATSGLKGYGIPYQVVLVPQSGATLPILSTGTEGHYGGIIILSEVAYEYASGWSSALTAAQWQTLYDYQTAFGVRMVRLDCFPNPTDFGE